MVKTTFIKIFGDFMKIEEVKNYRLFQGMDENEIETAIKSLFYREENYKKDSFILYAGDTTNRIGMVLDGSVTIESNDLWGNRTILSHIGKGQFFAETYALLPNKPLLVDVTANEDCKILFLQIGSLKKLQENPCHWKSKLTLNLLAISLNKNLHLSERSFHTSPKTIRGKVMSYLNTVAIEKGNNAFAIPFDRQQLADYLNVERTALSKELGKMQKDKLIKVKKNQFIINVK